MYQDKDKILSANHNRLYKVKGKTILTTDKGIFEYNNAKQDSQKSLYLGGLFGNKPINYFKEDKYGNIWFCEVEKIGVVDMSAVRPKIIYIPELNDKILAGGFESVNVIDSNNVFIGAEHDFFHLNYTKYKKAKYPLQTLVRKVALLSQKDSVIYGGYTYQNVNLISPSIYYHYNSLHFEFSSTLYGQEHNTEFSFFLKGFDKQWSEWAKKSDKDYTNLPAGNYTFQVKCRNNIDNESAVVDYTFTILPPWYQTYWAYLFFTLLFFGVIYLFYKRQKKIQTPATIKIGRAATPVYGRAKATAIFTSARNW